MSKYQLNLWLPNAVMANASETCKGIQNLRLYDLEHWQESCRELSNMRNTVNLVAMPTNEKVVLVSKKILRFYLKLSQPAEAKEVYFALWPKHHEYEVGVHVQPFLHQTFLPGMTTYNCVAERDGFLIEAAAAPNATGEQILEEIQMKLDTADLSLEELSFCGVIQDAYRAELDSAVLDALVQTSLKLHDRGPDFEWYPAANSLSEIGGTLPNTFAMGSGAFPEPMCVSWEANQNKKTTLRLDESFWAFVREFSQLLQ